MKISQAIEIEVTKSYFGEEGNQTKEKSLDSLIKNPKS
jgi:hypothetical protein